MGSRGFRPRTGNKAPLSCGLPHRCLPLLVFSRPKARSGKFGKILSGARAGEGRQAWEQAEGQERESTNQNYSLCLFKKHTRLVKEIIIKIHKGLQL